MQRISFFDSHFHIIDPRFPLIPNNNYLPPPFTIVDYYKRLAHFNVLGGIVVSGSFQGFDQHYLLTSLQELGPNFAGITQLPSSVSDDEILNLKSAGVRGLRFNLKRGGSENVTFLQSFATRVYELANWHVELYIDSGDLAELSSVLLKLPAVSIDHLGLSREGLPTLLALAERGVKVKATGFGRVDFNVSQILKDISLANPDALMFGTDLPSTRALRPFMDQDIQLILDVFEPMQAEKIFYLNALAFYRIEHGQA
ncbi:amidohydrolase family protein [Legionella jamestowniensis]|uniref:(2-pyrone-4,6-)dicarboxylic acid hydrolase n=1 Tax=Legionella jamestowniensis TaxID=455 RepID=A0A0W0UU52_9GAMM|nr:amidohydrolase family protein [Legionella jamestowniensis]KTD11402.1 (2-pyrone-4,6-)dicarboxylic acid hydrolase [Legionella jamestowniensis]OCH98742.1 2-pyrone-4,6-dicarboxylate hydrolase [Legionella jamestowniensis]SFL67850.1 Predicted metal-dependent hydrolase, TIM-barrel fold [Legionella jamestowniensis DSM 19215]